jgi:hypothetical protein
MATPPAAREIVAPAAPPPVAQPTPPTLATAAPAAHETIAPPLPAAKPTPPAPPQAAVKAAPVIVAMATPPAPHETVAAKAPPLPAAKPTPPQAASEAAPVIVAMATSPAPREPVAAKASAPQATVVALAAPALPRDLGSARAKSSAVARHAAARIEIANGAGRQGMAARMRTYLKSQHVPVARMTNDRSFRHPTSVIFYGKGSLAAAQRLASFLPIDVALHSDPRLVCDARLRLGADLLRFDARLRARGPRNAI